MSFSKSISTGGQGFIILGPDDPTASQDALITAGNGNCIVTCNVGSDTIATFQIETPRTDATNVRFVDTYPSGGFFPTSLEEDSAQNIVYIMNNGENGAIGAVKLDPTTCIATPLTLPPVFSSFPDQNTGLTGNEPPAGLATASDMLISPGGEKLTVSLKSANNLPLVVGGGRLITYDLTNNDVSFVNIPNVQVPFSLEYNDDGLILLVSALGLPAPDETPVPERSGALLLFPPLEEGSNNVTQSFTQLLNTGESATCWVRFSERNSGCTYMTNNIDSSITAARSQGLSLELTLPSPIVRLPNPIDISFSPMDENFLYAIATGFEEPAQEQSIHVYAVNSRTCGLVEIQSITDGLPSIIENTSGVAGLAIV